MLESRGFAAVTSTGGALTFRPTWTEAFREIPQVYICFDNDGPGQAGAERVARMIPHARLVRLPEEVGDGGDVTDFFVRLGRSREEFIGLLEAARPLQLVQMDTTSGQWVSGAQMAYVIALLDDYSRAILAAQAVAADSTAHNLAVLEAAVARYGPMQVLYSDNGSVFRVTRHGPSRFQAYRPEVLAGEVPTQLARALQELGAVPLTHAPGNARAKGKLERWNRFMQERLLGAGPFPSIAALDAALQDWLHYYNERHQHRALGGVPAARLVGYEPRALPAGARPLGDICALRETRKVTKDHAVSLAGVRYQLPREPNLVAFTVELRIRPGQTVRVWHDDRLIVELPHGGGDAPDGLSVAQVLEQILPRLDPKQAQPATRLPRRPTAAGA